MQPWQPGKRLLTDFDIKIGKLSASARKQQLTDQDIQWACSETDRAIARIIQRQDHEKQHDAKKNSRPP
ncbi:hypothetical protein BZ21_744 [Yersinia pseudotuberculosis]|uniref:hypothetical protein n=1 Tax=Yersinia pseudotuberculosis TaxID=633 RepID=UPI0005AD4B6A|nr:hypothetical protein [Yersinia pseudotuberculosis]AJJ01069.1 hypothetical protein BZ21_744 [Yersinia pseudotuberculosis]AXY32639.1 hypothetical protein CEQ20_03900 [Yersinia pseudotuberculosis]MBO1550234.1 hypothetical protein [Yersinia pseudotuberculosis]MBO1570360.1 hypothetical protein [Yersinia pseudotuberculosis]MBO1585358.1 hypothetical protein [Yersinia pseudotuberculosis]